MNLESLIPLQIALVSILMIILTLTSVHHILASEKKSNLSIWLPIVLLLPFIGPLLYHIKKGHLFHLINKKSAKTTPQEIIQVDSFYFE